MTYHDATGTKPHWTDSLDERVFPIAVAVSSLFVGLLALLGLGVL